jgi:hypothetical protein
MGALVINFSKDYTFDGRAKDFVNNIFVFFLEKNLFRVKKEPFFETGGKVSASIAVKCQGTRCESGTVAPL